MYGKHHSQSAKDKIGKAQTGKHTSQSTKDKISKALSGPAHPMYGKHHSQSTKHKLSKALSGAANARYNPDSKKTPCPNPNCPHGFDTPKPSVVLRHHLYGEDIKGDKSYDVTHSSRCGKWVKDQVAAGNDAVLKAALGLQWRKYTPAGKKP